MQTFPPLSFIDLMTRKIVKQNKTHDKGSKVSTSGFIYFKGTVSIISSDLPPCIDGNARFTKVPLNPLVCQGCRSYSH